MPTTALPTPAPTAAPTHRPTTAAPTAAPSPIPTHSPFVEPPRSYEPRCGKMKILNKKKATVVIVQTADSVDCHIKCSEICPGCSQLAYHSWSFKSGSKAGCTCFGSESE